MEGLKGRYNHELLLSPEGHRDYLIPRQKPLHIKEITETGETFLSTLRIVNNEGSKFSIRNETVGMVKKKYLKELLLYNKADNFGLYLLNSKNEYDII